MRYYLSRTCRNWMMGYPGGHYINFSYVWVRTTDISVLEGELIRDYSPICIPDTYALLRGVLW